jgi:hypothetical protein
MSAPLNPGARSRRMNLKSVPWDERLPQERRALLDRLYAAVDRDLDRLFESVGLRLAG